MRNVLVWALLTISTVLTANARPSEDSGAAKQLFEKALKRQQHKEYEQAIALYRKAIELVPSDAMYAHAIGSAFQAKGDIETAIGWYRRAVELAPGNEDYPRILGAAKEVRLMRGCAMKFNNRNLPEAIRMYEQALALKPNASSWTSLAGAYQANGQFQKAREAYEKALGLEPLREGENKYFIAVLDENDGQGAKALEEYCEYIRSRPKGHHASAAKKRIRVLRSKVNAVLRLPIGPEIDQSH